MIRAGLYVRPAVFNEYVLLSCKYRLVRNVIYLCMIIPAAVRTDLVDFTTSFVLFYVFSHVFSPIFSPCGPYIQSLGTLLDPFLT